MPGTPFAKRLLLAIPTGFFFFAYVFVMWAAIGFGLAGNTTGPKGETAGYMAIVVAPLGAVVGLLAAFGAMLFPYGPRWWLRLVILAIAFVAVGFGVFVSAIV